MKEIFLKTGKTKNIESRFSGIFSAEFPSFFHICQSLEDLN